MHRFCMKDDPVRSITLFSTRPLWPVCLLWLSCCALGAEEIQPEENLAQTEEPSPELVAGFFTEKAHRIIDAAMSRPTESSNC